MPRNYVRKTDKASYPIEKLLEAVRAVKNGTLSGYAASKQYGIPRSTIINRVYERKGLKSNSLGRATVLSRETEECLVKNLHVMEKHGFGLTRKELLETVGQYVSAKAIKNPFKNGVPGEDWFLDFKKRHNLSIKKPQPVEYARKKACSPQIIYPYYDMLEKTVNDLGLSESPSHIWNVDETSFSKDPSKSKVVGSKGYTSTRTIASPGKDNTTVLLGCNAVGEKTPPMIVYKGKYVWDEWTTDKGYPGTAYAATSNGWMETEVFEAFFEKVFLKTVGQKRPILLIYDGHATHVGINLVEKAREAKITILKIPAHTSHLLQPLDLAVNKSLKDKWDQDIVKWQRLNIGKSLPKKDFAEKLGKIWYDLKPDICAAGFRKGGIYPLNKNAVPEKDFNQDLLREWKLKLMCNATDNVQNSTKQQPINVTLFTNQTAANTNQDPRETTKQTDLITKEKLSEPETKGPNPDSLVSISLKIVNLILNGSDPTFQKNMPQNAPNTLVNLSDQLNAEHVGSSNTINISKHTPKIQILENRTVTFEDLLLLRIKSGTSTKIKKKRMAIGAEVITHDDVYKKTLEAQTIKKETQAKKKKTNVTETLTKEPYKRKAKEVKTEDLKYKAKQNLKNNKGNKSWEINPNENVGQSSKMKKKQNKTQEKYRKKRKYSTSSSENETEIKYDEDSDDTDYWESVLKESDDEDNTAQNTEVYDIDKENYNNNAPYRKDDWLLVKFCTKKSVKHFVGVVLSMNDYGSPVVKYTRMKSKAENETVFTFPMIEDISEVNHTEDIVNKLPQPAIGRRGQFIFKMSFKMFNIQ